MRLPGTEEYAVLEIGAAALKETDGGPIIIHGSARLNKQMLSVVESECYTNGLQKLVDDVVR